MSNATVSDGACELSPHARAFSTVLMTFVGSIIGGLSGGFFLAFMTAWISWLAGLRIIVVGFWEVTLAILGRPLEDWHHFWDAIPGSVICNPSRKWDDEFFRSYAEATPPNPVGFITWTYSALWAPTIQIMWVISNWHTASGALKIVRGLSISVAALPLTYDTKQRYADATSMRFGRWAGIVFNLITAVSCLTLGVCSCVLLIKGAIDANVKWYICLIYGIFLLVWMRASLVFILPHDESHSGNIIAGLLMGIFGGALLAFPSFFLMLRAAHEPGMSLGEYIRCEPEAAWKKLVAFFP